MIGWNAKILMRSTSGAIRNISDFDISFDTFYMIATQCEYLSLLSMAGRDRGVSEIASDVRTLLSTDIIYAWAMMAKGSYDIYNDSARKTAFSEIMPAIWTSYEDAKKAAHDVFINSGYDPIPCFYVPSLNRLFSGDFIMSVSNDGGLTSLSDALPSNSGNWYNGFFGLSPIVACVEGYSENANLLNLRFFAIGLSAEKNVLGIVDRVRILAGREWTSELKSIMFSSSSNPDFSGIIPPVGPINPYEPVDPSGPGNIAPGTFDDSSDLIPFPSLPTLSAADTGFTRIYNPTLSQVRDLARYLWTDNNLLGTLWNKIKQFFEDPMQSFIAFNLVPCPVPDGGVEEFQLLFIPTGVNLTTAATQFVDVDCGTCEIQRYYGSALDQTPYTKISCFLPYIGMVALDTDEVMGRTLQVKYRIDIVSGSCVAYIIVDGNCLYQYSGHCAITIPFASADFSRYVQAAISVAGTALGSVSPMIGSAINDVLGIERAEQQTDFVVTKYYDKVESVRNPDTGRQITAGATHTTTRTIYPAEQTSTKASFAGLSPSNVSNTVGQVMSSKASIQHSGTFSGNSGYLGLRRPYLLITRPRMCLPENYQSLNGYPAMITMTLGDCQGFTRIQQVQLTGMHATNPEQAEILELLKSGVIF